MRVAGHEIHQSKSGIDPLVYLIIANVALVGILGAAIARVALGLA